MISWCSLDDDDDDDVDDDAFIITGVSRIEVDIRQTRSSCSAVDQPYTLQYTI